MSFEEQMKQALVERDDQIVALKKQLAAVEHRKRDLRDEFAGAALTGLLANATTTGAAIEVYGKSIGRACYAFADILLEARGAKR